MKVNISVLEVSLEFQGVSTDGKNLDLDKFHNSKLKERMYITAEPLYKNMDIEFDKLIDIVKSDYRQYSPFVFQYGIKKSDNWKNDNQNVIVFDVDDGLSVEDAKVQFKDYEYLIATTKSHQLEKKGLKCDRFRIILPAKNIPKGDKYFDMMRILEDRFEFIDKQVNTKTGAFLGSFNCEYSYNKGMIFDCSPILKMIKQKEVINTHKSSISIPTTQNYNKSEDLPIQDIKSRLTREIVADIVSSCGFEVNRKFMFKYRQNEKTPSASISPELLIKDFGSELSTDVIGFVMEVNGIDFKTAVVIVAGFVNVSLT
jgi:hypothetical protein